MEIKKKIELSVFFPFHNEESNCEQTIINAYEYLNNNIYDFEIIAVDDGSTDKTSQILETLQRKIPELRIVTHQKNIGYGGALQSGFENATKNLIFYTDGDGQFNINELDNLIPLITDCDIVSCFRANRQDNIYRLLLAICFNYTIYILFGLKLKDIDCAFKLYKKEVIDNTRPYFTLGGMIDTEMLVKASRANYNIKQIPVNHYARKFGASSGGNIKVVLRAFNELLLLWYKLNIKNLYLIKKYKKFIIYCSIGLIGAIVDFGIFFGLLNYTNINYQLSNILSSSTGILNNFLFNSFFNFKKTNQLGRRLIFFYAIGLLGIVISSGLLFIGVDSFHMNPLIAKLGTVIIVAIIQFNLNKKITFKN